MRKKKLDALQVVLSAAQHSASAVFNSSISNQRAYLQDRYHGEKYGDEVEDRSDYVDTSVRDSIEAIKPELMDIFYGGDRVVDFAPRGEDDVDAADLETEVCNYVVNQMNDGYYVFLGWFHDALAFKNGYVKRYWEERLAPEIEEYDELTSEEALEVIRAASRAADVEVKEQWADDDSGLIGMKIQVTPRDAHVYRIENVPPEEVIVHPEWTRLDFDGCPYVAHKRTMTVSDLIEMGFDRKSVEDMPTYNSLLDSREKSGRHQTERGGDADFDDTKEPSMREVLVYENYVRHDSDGDGIAELLQVYTGDNGIVLNRGGRPAVEPVDAAPFNVISPFPIPHKHYGLSAAEMVDDMARAKTVLTRQLLDNVVGANNPDIVVDEEQMTASTVEDLEVTGLGRVIRIPGGQASASYLFPPNLAAQSLAALEYVSSEKEQRLGVTRYSQGLDADSLNKTATGVRQIMGAAQKRILLIARNFAETGVRRLFLDIHRDLRKGPLKSIVAKLRGDFVEVSPRTWADRADMVVNVGLGTGDRDMQFQRLGMVLQEQKEGLGAGLVYPSHIHHTLTKMLELSGFKDANAYFPEPPEGPMPQPEPAPDPIAVTAQIEAAKIDFDRAKLASDERIEMEKIASRERIEAAKLNESAADLEAESVVREIEKEMAPTGGGVAVAS